MERLNCVKGEGYNPKAGRSCETACPRETQAQEGEEERETKSPKERCLSHHYKCDEAKVQQM